MMVLATTTAVVLFLWRTTTIEAMREIDSERDCSESGGPRWRFHAAVEG